MSSSLTNLKPKQAFLRGANSQFNAPDEPHRLIVLGVGSLQTWYAGRSTFSHLVNSLSNQIVLWNSADGKATQGIETKHNSIHWLGYYRPEYPYTIDETVFTRVSMLAVGLSRLLHRYPNATVVDVVCHSLMGTVALYGAVAGIFDTSRIRSIMTINSPLKGSDEFIEAYRADFGADKKPFMGRQEEPVIFSDLRTNSEVMRSIQSSTVSPVRTLINVVSAGDTIVAPEFGVVNYATKQVELTSAELNDEGVNSRRVHTEVLRTKKLCDLVVDMVLRKP